ncbi:MAG: exodeoxyribonuclease VII large subunit [Desulfovibrio sp.]|uniref:exodeoxyribonuclease VII large subunit n=1 Tax=Desulfovibrio sp. 7SRBS1 TaxID=3378064 RepID=UPI003B3D86EA
MHIFTVSEISGALRDVVEAQFPFVWVRGEVTNLSRPASGHIYFSLGDGNSVLNVVWFRKSQWTGGDGCVHPMTGEVCEGGPDVLEDGLEVMCAGRLSVYSGRSTVQLIAELVQEVGTSTMALAFEQLKKELKEQGYFDSDRKMELPPAPRRIAVVTAATGAAIRDFLRIAESRGTGAQIHIHPVLVQGREAPVQIASALDDICEEGWADAAVVIRGGGSLEDLWAFNTREVADAIFRATLPVVSGVGHEVDVTIADLVADVRAATPSHAAQLLWPERRELWQRLDDLDMGLENAWLRLLRKKEEALATQEKGLGWLSPARRLDRLLERFERENTRLAEAGTRFFKTRITELDRTTARLATVWGPSRWTADRLHIQNLEQGLQNALTRHLERAQNKMDLTTERLHAMDPEKPLARGYSLVQIGRTGKFLRGPDDVKTGDGLRITAANGNVQAVVTDTQDES